jgi:hypothetical protein
MAAAALATAAFGAASAAQANPNVYLSVGFHGGPAYVEPAPVYVQPRSVYVQPRPVYIAPPAFVYERPWRPSYDRRYEDERAWRRAEWQRREWRQHHWEQQPSYGRHWD